MNFNFDKEIIGIFLWNIYGLKINRSEDGKIY